MTGMAHKDAHFRGNLPHGDFAESVRAITFRLGDSMANAVVKEWRLELDRLINDPDREVSQKAEAELQRRIARCEDEGNGACFLAKPEHARVLQELLIAGHEVHYQLIDWCIMPNHVHVLIRLMGETSPGKIVKQWKAASDVRINRAEGRTGSLWMEDCHDRLVRDWDHFHSARAYVRNNPVKAGLCHAAEEWEFSGAGVNWSAEFIPHEVVAGSRGMNSALPVAGAALSGHLDLRCDVRADGVSYISRQSFRAPIHLSKSHVDQGCLVQSIVNPTAGFFDGDFLRSNVEVGAGARLVLSMPSASRVYRSRSGGAAVSHQKFQIGENASLEWIPEPFIPHAGARFVQKTEMDLHPTASLLFFDWIAPGRVAMGEIFAYEHLRWELDLSLNGALIARERYNMRPDDHSLEALRAKFPAAHYLTVYAAGAMTRNWPCDEIDGLSSPDCYLGYGPLAGGVRVLRALCRDSLTTRKLLETLRALLYQVAGQVPPGLGRHF